jgi:hypothetical protein
MALDLFDTSRIPDNDAYWDALAERVTLGVKRRGYSSGVEWLTHSRASIVAASLILAAALAFLIVPRPNQSTSNLTSVSTRALAPSDDAGRAILLLGRPPSVGALLLDEREMK